MLTRRSRLSPGAWWRRFAALIAAPALVLSWLGLRAGEAERIQRQQEMQDAWSRLSRLTAASILHAFGELETDLQRIGAGAAASVGPTAAAIPVVTFERSGLVTFPRCKLYFGSFGQRPRDLTTLTTWADGAETPLHEAQAAEARGLTAEAAAAFVRAALAEPRLQGWSTIALARMQMRSRARGSQAPLRIADASWGTSPALSPSGLPVALVAAASIEDGPPAGAVFLPLLVHSLASLREGRWWLSGDERRFYGRELAGWIAAAGGTPPPDPDLVLEQSAEIARVVRQSPPARRQGPSHAVERSGMGSLLLVWIPSHDPDVWIGAALAPRQTAQLLSEGLDALLGAEQTPIVVSDPHGSVVWSRGPGAAGSTAMVLPGLEGWHIAFAPGPAAGGWRARELLWYAVIAVPLLVLLAGVGMTGSVVRREIALGRMQSDFVGAVTHEFKTPIASIRLLLERAAAGRLRSADDAALYYGAMEREIDRLERLVNRVLEAQQIDAGERRYEFAPESVAALAEEVIRHLQPSAAARDIALDLRADPSIPLVAIDRTAIADAIENLVDNAIKYSQPRTRVTVGVEAVAGDVVVEVTDQGIGIAPEDVPRVFEKFYRGARGNRENVRGTGLGLALVKATAEAHGGRVDVSSAPGEGSRFSLRLPARPGGATV